MRKRFLEGFHYDAHPMGMLVSAIAALSTFYPDAADIQDSDNRYKQPRKTSSVITVSSIRFCSGFFTHARISLRQEARNSR